jgi:pimeloyl-ACP methyl ester carboxylesterase
MGAALVTRFVLFPPRSRPDHLQQVCDAIRAEGGQVVDVGDGVKVWSRPNPNPHPNPHQDTPAILFSHGNSCDMLFASMTTRRIAQITGCVTYGYDYYGYGLSVSPSAVSLCREKPRSVSQQDIYDNMSQVLAHVSALHPRVILVGESLGSAPTCFGAAAAAFSHRVQSVVLLCPFVSVMAVAFRRTRPLPLLDLFNNIEHATNIQCPVFVIHGSRDALIPESHGRELAAAAPRGQFIGVPLASHGDLWDAEVTLDVLRGAVAGGATRILTQE